MLSGKRLLSQRVTFHFMGLRTDCFASNIVKNQTLFGFGRFTGLLIDRDATEVIATPNFLAGPHPSVIREAIVEERFGSVI